MGIGDQRKVPAALPPEKTRYPLYWRLNGPQSRSGRVRKISATPGFDPRTLQPVASRYNDWAIAARTKYVDTYTYSLQKLKISALFPHGVLSQCINIYKYIYIYIYIYIKVKVIPQEAEVAQGIPGRLRPHIFLTFGTTRVVGRQPYAPAAFTPGTHFQGLRRFQGTWFREGSHTHTYIYRIFSNLIRTLFTVPEG